MSSKYQPVQKQTDQDDYRVMEIVRNLEVGGAQEVVRTLTENLTEYGAMTIVCSFKDGPLRREIETQGVPVLLLPEREYSILAFPLFIKEILLIRSALLDIITQYRINIIQTHLLRVLNIPVISLMKVKPDLLVFWTIHNERFSLREDHLQTNKWLLRPKRWVYRLLYLKAAERISGYIAVSKQVKQAIVDEIGAIGDKVTIIFNGVDFKRYRPGADKKKVRAGLGIDPESKVISVVATFKEQKGHRFLIEATPSLIDKFSNLLILFIGDGELKEELEYQTKNYHLDGVIKFLGIRMDIPELLAASDIFVLPSLWEGLPMAIVEAMASELPIVATDVSGSAQAILPGKTGMLVPPGDPKALDDAISYLLRNPDYAKNLGKAARSWAEEEFSAKKQANDHLNLFRQCMEKDLFNHTSMVEQF